MTDKEQML